MPSHDPISKTLTSSARMHSAFVQTVRTEIHSVESDEVLNNRDERPSSDPVCRLLDGVPRLFI
jgi:hypothetical protein